MVEKMIVIDIPEGTKLLILQCFDGEPEEVETKSLFDLELDRYDLHMLPPASKQVDQSLADIVRDNEARFEERFATLEARIRTVEAGKPCVS